MDNDGRDGDDDGDDSGDGGEDDDDDDDDYDIIIITIIIIVWIVLIMMMMLVGMVMMIVKVMMMMMMLFQERLIVPALSDTDNPIWMERIWWCPLLVGGVLSSRPPFHPPTPHPLVLLHLLCLFGGCSPHMEELWLVCTDLRSAPGAPPLRPMKYSAATSLPPPLSHHLPPLLPNVGAPGTSLISALIHARYHSRASVRPPLINIFKICMRASRRALPSA